MSSDVRVTTPRPHPPARRAFLAAGVRFTSLLNPGPVDDSAVVADQTLIDLHLDDLIAAAAPGTFQRQVWKHPLTDPDAVAYRQAVLADLGDPQLRRAAEAFCVAVAAARRTINAAHESHYRRPAELSVLEGVVQFAAAATALARAVTVALPTSLGLRRLSDQLAAFLADDGYCCLVSDCDQLLAEVRAPAVELGLQSGTVWVAADSGRPAWTEQVRAFFARFANADNPGEPVPPRVHRYLNHVEARAVDLVAELHPETFARVHDCAAANSQFLPAAVERLAEELRFYLGFLALVDRTRAGGVAWSRPRIVGLHDDIRIDGFIDPVLALRTVGDGRPVANDLILSDTQRIAFITGPNQGGKTTLARAIGHGAHLAALGLLVPASTARLPLLNPVLTHFPQPDDPEHQHGGLAEEVVRLHEIVEQAGPGSLLILNELFSTTSAEDAVELAGLVVPEFLARGCRVIWVTFLEELVASVRGAASLVGQVAADDPTRPTFQFHAQPPTGRSYATALAARHALSRADLSRRLA